MKHEIKSLACSNQNRSTFNCDNGFGYTHYGFMDSTEIERAAVNRFWRNLEKRIANNSGVPALSRRNKKR